MPQNYCPNSRSCKAMLLMKQWWSVWVSTYLRQSPDTLIFLDTMSFGRSVRSSDWLTLSGTVYEHSHWIVEKTSLLWIIFSNGLQQAVCICLLHILLVGSLLPWTQISSCFFQQTFQRYLVTFTIIFSLQCDKPFRFFRTLMYGPWEKYQCFAGDFGWRDFCVPSRSHSRHFSAKSYIPAENQKLWEN